MKKKVNDKKNLQKVPGSTLKSKVCSELFFHSKFLGSSKRLHSSPFSKMESFGFDDKKKKSAKIKYLNIAAILIIIFIVIIVLYVGEFFIIKIDDPTINNSYKNKTSLIKNNSIERTNENINSNINHNNTRVNRTIIITTTNTTTISGKYCGNTICETGEMGICFLDCSWCGDSYCENETCQTCPNDCGNCNSDNYCGDNVCSKEECKSGCIKDCSPSNCIDSICESKVGENCLNSLDCSCGIGEYCDSDLKCKGSYCGNLICDNEENCENCADCVCDNLKTCSSGICKTYCGNSVCEVNESEESCSQDCGRESYENKDLNPDSNYPIIFLHGHSIFEESISTYSVNGFKEFQEKLETDSLYKNLGVILPNSNINDYNYGEWGRYSKPISVRTTYYIGVISSSQVFINNDEARRPINEYADRLSRVIEIVLHHTGKNKVIIISHSMGGLVGRAYIKNYGGIKVDKLIEIGTPNHGYYTSDLGYNNIARYFGCSELHPGQECADMSRGSSFLTNLNSIDETPGYTQYLTIAGDCTETNGKRTDQVIRVESVKLEGARNIVFLGRKFSDYLDTLHNEMIYPDVVSEPYSYTKQFLTGTL